ncbi:MAG: phenylalanine--tRNA ligase subunit beta [Chthoniobacterales bacterium]
MKFSINWLREFVELPASIEQLAETLTIAGVEIEGIERRGADFERVVVAQIKESKQHPNADRLSVCQVDDGSGVSRQIVCGAKNYQVGDKVPLALPDAVLPHDLKIRASKLRGVESGGMLCSAKELGIAEDAAGLLILSPAAKVGAPIGTLFPADTIIEVEITPNRGDLLSYLGLAREIAGLTSRHIRAPEIAPAVHSVSAGVGISASRECPFYSARRISDVKVGQSPEWLRARLEASGLRSINSVVDITNYVMLELGQPLHAFDAEKVSGAINVRLAYAGEEFLALDGKTYSLRSEHLVVADQVRAVAIAGVMGGEDTGVKTATRHVLLESAYFLPASVRRTARELNLPSDSSYRFERGVDPAMTLRASARATQLIGELARGTAETRIGVAGKLPEEDVEIRLRSSRCQRYLGVSLDEPETTRVLEQFGLHKTRVEAGETWWRPPSYRTDLRREVDLIEEVIRAYGIEKIPARDRSRFTPMTAADRIYDREIALRRSLVARGIFEARTSALVPRAFKEEALPLKNPLSEDHVALRPTLIPGLLSVLERNLRLGATSTRVFELGRVFRAGDGKESRNLALVFSGRAQAEPHWRSGAEWQLDFFDVKGVLESLGRTVLSFRRTEKADFAFAAEILGEDKILGLAGQLSGARTAALGAHAPVLVAEIALEEMLTDDANAPVFRELERFPAVTRDIALIASESLAHERIVAVLQEAKEPLLEGARLFDLFDGKEAAGLGGGRKSLAYTLTYRDKNRTLTSEEVTVAHMRIRERLKAELPVELRE